MKSPQLAAFLSFVLPGAGLWYIGRTGLGFANLTLAIAVPVIWLDSVMNGIESVHYVALAIAAGSAGFAHALAGRGDRHTEPDETRRSTSAMSSPEH